jgi:hypothetical protein
MEKVTEAPRFSFAVAKPGSKAETAIEAGITLTPTLNKFEVNGLASKLIGLVSGTGDKDEVKTPENSMTILVQEESTDINNKFFVCKGLEGQGAKLATNGNEQGFGKTLGCTYSGIYARIVKAVISKDITAPEVSKQRLRQEGLAVDNTLLYKIYAKVESIGVHEVAGEERELYRLFDFMVTPHKPKKNKE